MIDDVRAVVRTRIPPDSTVLVVSKGDHELLQVDGRRAVHFPQEDEGGYLLFPRTAAWWLTHYGGLRCHLQSRYTTCAGEDPCVIFRLRDAP